MIAINCCISHTSLAQFWDWASRLEGATRAANEQLRALGGTTKPMPSQAATKLLEQPRIATLPAPSLKKPEILSFAASHEIATPVDLLMPNQALRQNCKSYRCHCLTTCANASFIQTEDDILVGAPELCLLQIAQFLDPLDLLLLVTEYCSEYTLDPSVKRGFSRRNALASLKSIEELASAMKGARGVKSLKHATTLALEGAYSPKEAGFALALSLPAKDWLGYGCSKPLVNYEIELGAKARAIYGKQSCKCDLYWPGIDVEYESDLEHSGNEGGAKDSTRAAALALEGIEVVHVYSKNVATSAALEATARLIGKKIGQEPCLLAGSERKEQVKLQRKLLGHHSRPACLLP